MNMKELTSTDDNQFYPTPPELARKMLQGVDWTDVEQILEPSAGKGNLIEIVGEFAFSKQNYEGYSYRRDKRLEVDCVEIDPHLRSILKYQFGEERKNAECEKCPRYPNGNVKSHTPLYDTLDKTTVRIVHDDFLTYKPYKRYDLIVMNPPFKDGDKHLLHALDIQKNGGGIICLLNAETLRNPFSNTRKELQKRLDELGAEIEYVNDAYSSAERSADVDIAIIRAVIPEAETRSTIFDRLEKAAEAENFYTEVTDVVIGDYIEAIVRRFNVECRAGIELIREWQALSPYLLQDIKESTYNRPILKLEVNGENDADINKFLRCVRLKYWRELFTNEKFMRKLTTKLREQYISTVDRMRDYDFTMFNIQRIIVEMNSQVMTGVQAEIMNVFDKLTCEYAHYAECTKNIHYYSGWKTNKAHKIGKKSIIPAYLQSYSWSGDKFDVYRAYGVLSDLEKVFDYLSGNMSREVTKYDINSALSAANSRGQARNIECTYFKVDIFKKGTVHIKFTCPELVDRLNIYAARNRNWLPPNYGKTRYENLTDEEKTIVNDFHRNEKETEVNPKKSAERYERVVSMSGFYLADPVMTSPLMIEGGDV